MPHLIWTPTGLVDVQRLYRFLAPKSPNAARKAVATIRSSVAGLAENPKMGRPVDELDEGYRERIVPFGSGCYVVLYRHVGERVLILAVRHGREAGYPVVPSTDPE